MQVESSPSLPVSRLGLNLSAGLGDVRRHEKRGLRAGKTPHTLALTLHSHACIHSHIPTPTHTYARTHPHLRTSLLHTHTHSHDRSAASEEVDSEPVIGAVSAVRLLCVSR